MQTVEVKVNNNTKKKKKDWLANFCEYSYIQYFTALQLLQLENIMAAIILGKHLAEKLGLETQST